ncbi:hydantoinase/oxoprolinase family protein [Nocardia sp. 348MFTsu5.1]|uniref:hydantoinase/oxoprolinase family protein n=1 Tax=Nocardia sp. 348MFTsu5.1 TaxID=1172185 RepID=UPI0003828185|nr:hydantoinase/oxoprolinase family protein [Nocardia sp. 348MFTsu5.1]
MKYVVGIDIGGTFTDCVAIDSNGQITIGKSSSTPPNFDQGFMNAIGVVAETLGRTVEEFLPDVEALLHGCTVGTNALVEGRTAKVGLITTAGHAESMFIMRGGGRLTNQSPDYIAHVAAHRKPAPLVPRSLVRVVNERVAFDGTVLAKLDDDEVRSVVQDLLDEGVTAFAVSLLWSVANDSHEQQISKIIAELAPHAFVSLASGMVSRIGEYERTVAAVVNSLIGPEMTSYLSTTRQSLANAGFDRELGIMTCSGGLVDASLAQERPILTIGSGPVAGVVGSQTLARRGDTAPPGADRNVPLNVITADMGGTTLDVGVLARAVPKTRSTSWLGQFEYFVPTIDVRSVGAGGGSIIHRHESTGTIRVGPESAGANPGPAAFMRGGTRPTITDADLVLGYLNPDYFLKGGIHLSVDASREALAAVGEPLGMSAEEVAAAAVRIVDNHMADEIRLLSIHEGHDPRDFSVFAFGGNGAVHATAFARELGVSQVVVPLGDLASGFSALGVAASEFLVVEEAGAMSGYPFDLHRINTLWKELEETASARMASQGVKADDVVYERSAEMRYTQQVHEVLVSAPDGYYTDETADELVARFENEYSRVYGETSLMPGAGHLIRTLVVKARAKVRTVDISRGGTTGTGRPPSKGERGVIWYENGLERVPTPTYDGSGFVTGMSVEGPAIVEYPDTTLVVRGKQIARVSETGSVVIDINIEEKN